MYRSFRLLIVAIACLFTASISMAMEMPNYLASTPVGSWVTMEETTTRGKKTEVMEMTRSLVGEENVDGKRHLWIEMKTQTYKVNRKGIRKAHGDPAIIKLLTDASVFNGNAANILGNIRNLAVRMYVKNGDKVMDLSGGGAFADAMLQATGTSMDFKMTDLNERRNIETPLGTVSANLYQGVGEASVKVLIKTVNTRTETQMWLSDEVPFGLVESTSKTTINGNEESGSSRIVAVGMSGAASEIDENSAANPFDALRNLGN